MSTRLGKALKTKIATVARLLLLVILTATFAACSSGGDDDGSSGNRAPTASAGGDQTVLEMSAVQLLGVGSDPDAGDTLNYSWSQTGGSAVTISNATSATANFTAPDVTVGAPEVLTFQLTVTDATGLASTDSVSVTVQEPAAVVTISGNMLYEFPTPNNNCNGLNFGNIQLRPIRQATVQILDDAIPPNVLDTDVTDDFGAYSVTVNASTNVVLRVLAEMKKGGSPSWDVEVRNNVIDPTDPNPPALGQRPMYAMDLALDSGVIDQTVDLTATTGWGGSSYTNPRVAAPFAVLDAIYSGINLIAAVDGSANFVPLDAFWSPDNTNVQGTGTLDENIASGEIGTSYYSSDKNLFLLGKDGFDAEEFDDHVIVHEWGHYFEDSFSRSDSIGGSHGIGDLLDARVAFGEGFATALSGMALDNPIYCDTLWSGGQLRGFDINIESEAGGTAGWFNEISVMKLVYDLWDTNNDGADTSDIGFGPIYSVMTGAQSATPAFTSLFSFATNLKQAVNAQDETFLDALLTEQNVDATVIDIYGSMETNDGPGTPDDVLPIYTPLTLGVTETVCANSQFDNDRTGNKLSEHRYLTLNLPADQSVTFTATANPAPSTPTAGFDCSADPDDPENHEHSDPDFWIWRNGVWAGWGVSCEPNSEIATMSLGAGNYAIDFNEFRHEDESSPGGFPDQVCFDFTAN